MKKQARLLVSDTLLVELLKGTKSGFGGSFVVLKNGLPPDAKIVNHGTELGSLGRVVEILVESESFDEIEEKSVPPELDPPVFKAIFYGSKKYDKNDVIEYSFEEALHDDPAVYQLTKGGVPLRELVAFLVKQKQELFDQIVALQGIAPKKVKDKDGNEMIWRCPDELIPEIEL